MLKLAKIKGSPHWYIQGTLRGTRVRESTGTDSRPHAEVLLAKRQSEILDRQTFGEKRTAIFAEAVELYLQQGGEARYVSPLLERWGTWVINTITQAEVARAAHELYPGRKPSHHDRVVFTPTNAIIKMAWKAGLCEFQIFDRPKVKRQPVEYAQLGWYQQVIPECRLQLAAIIMFLSLTGCRVTEACDLTVRDLDLERGEAILRHTKNGTSRLVEFSGELAALLSIVVTELEADAGAADAALDPDTRVFGYSGRHSVNQAIERACERAGARYLSSHKIGRHAFAARLLRDGASLKTTQGAGGWKSLTVLSNHYGHLERSEVSRIVRASGKELTKIEYRKSEKS